jgi:hypothetical protein
MAAARRCRLEARFSVDGRLRRSVGSLLKLTGLDRHLAVVQLPRE